MRVLYLTEEPITFSGSMVRGGQIHVRNVIRGLRERGHDAHVLDWNAKRDDRSYHHSLPPRFRFGVDPLRTVPCALRIAQQIDADIIISKTRKTYLPGLLTARLAGIPHVVHVGSSPQNVGGGSLLARLETASVTARLRAGHDAYFVVCDALADDLDHLGVPRDRIFDVKNAVDTDRFHPEHVLTQLADEYASRIDALRDGRLVIGFVGGLHSYKGLDDLADALDRVETDVAVVIAGDGPERRRLERRFGTAAVFLGPVPYEQMPALYHHFDAFVLPSHTEGLPRVVLEAQATGTPVIATRVGGVPELISDGETGLLCDPRDPASLAAAIRALTDDIDLREHIGCNGRAAVEASYSWDALYERYEQYLRSVAETGQ